MVKTRIYERLREALEERSGTKDFAHLPATEKKAIRSILKATLKDLPAEW